MEMLAAPTELNHDRHGSPFGAEIPAGEVRNFFYDRSIESAYWQSARSGSVGPVGLVASSHADVGRCSCARCVKTRPTPRSTATGCWCGRATSGGSRAGHLRLAARSGYRVLHKVSEIVRQEMDRGRRPGGAAADRPAARALGAQRPRRGVRRPHVPPPRPQGHRRTACRRRRRRSSRRSSPRSTARTATSR